MARPVLKFEIAFDSGYSTPAASRTWTDVTSYVLQASGAGISVGRPDELSTAAANQLQLTLDNSDGRFTAGLSTSPYYPNVKLGRPVRVTSTPAGQAASVRFLGYVHEWPVEWPEVVGTYAEARLTAVSRLARISLGTELRSIIEEEILLDSPAAYYTLSEPEGAPSAGDRSGNTAEPLRPKGSGSAVTFGAATGPGTDGLTCASFTNASGPGQYLSTGLAVTGVESVTLEAFAAVTEDGGIVELANAALTARLSIGIVPTGEVFGQVLGTGGAVLEVNGVTDLTDSTVRHFALRATRAAGTMTLELFVDGASIGTDTGAYSSFPAFTVINVGSCPAAAIGTLVGSVAHVAVFAGAEVAAARIASHADAGLTGFEGETPAERLARYAAYATVGEVDFETGQVPDLVHIDTTGKTALACMRDVETTESGVLFDAPDGTLTFHDRSHRYGAASVLTLDVDAGEVQPGYAPKLDNLGMLNDVTATGSTGITARVVDQDSIDDDGSYRESLDLATSNPDEPLQAAAWSVGNYAEPAVRVASLTVELAKLSAARQTTVLAVGVGDLITVSNLMTQSDTSSKRFFVEGWTERIGETHTIEFNVSPAEVFDVWILGQSALDSGTRLAY